jgi:ATPase subunit of ABC transporter with duplicated ATPase domains
VSSVYITRLSFSYQDSVPLLSDLSLQLAPGWYGVVGPNGAGKTTFLRLLAAELSPERGEIRVHPPSFRPILCSQTIDRREPEIVRFAESTEREAKRLLGQLELEPHDLERWSTLSPGERKRWQIGAALSVSPELLLLDEPTNHLDAEARALLLGALHRFQGIGVVVSHDRLLLNELSHYTIRFHQGEVRVWTGNYDEARRDWEAKAREELDAYERVRREERKLKRRLADRRQRRTEAEAQMSTRKRMKGPQDSDARARFKAKRRRSAEVSLGRDVQLTRRKIDRVTEQLQSFHLRKTLGRSLFVDYTRAPVPVLMSIDMPEVRVGERTLLEAVQLTVERESRIRVAGPNGIGKSTLLAHLLKGARIPESRLIHLPQELGPERERELLESVRALGPEERGRVLTVVAALGVDPEALLASERPSPGEARKLLLAYGLGRQVWALVLDEPTNHLDLPSIERLQDSLQAYPGALVLVTHDEQLARRCTSTRWDLVDRRVHVRTEGALSR